MRDYYFSKSFRLPRNHLYPFEAMNTFSEQHIAHLITLFDRSLSASKSLRISGKVRVDWVSFS